MSDRERERFSVRLSDPIQADLEALVESGLYDNRSEAARHAIRSLLLRHADATDGAGATDLDALRQRRRERQQQAQLRTPAGDRR